VSDFRDVFEVNVSNLVYDTEFNPETWCH